MPVSERDPENRCSDFDAHECETPDQVDYDRLIATGCSPGRPPRLTTAKRDRSSRPLVGPAWRARPTRGSARLRAKNVSRETSPRDRLAGSPRARCPDISPARQPQRAVFDPSLIAPDALGWLSARTFTAATTLLGPQFGPSDGITALSRPQTDVADPLLAPISSRLPASNSDEAYMVG